MDIARKPGPLDARETILATGQRLMAVKGFSAVGLNEILAEAGVPKGSFYHYFDSKDAFGQSLLDGYFAKYLVELDTALKQPGLTMAERLLKYWQACPSQCLAVKMAAEVADLSEAMRLSIKRGTTSIVGHLAAALEAGVADGSIVIDGAADITARSLYQLWLGSSVMAKIARDARPFEAATTATRQILHIPGAAGATALSVAASQP